MKMDYHQYITRIQLKGHGLSSYQTKVVTRNIVAIDKENKTNIYLLPDAIASIKAYLAKPKITEKTRQSLVAVLPKLIQQLNNITPLIFDNGTDPELSKLSKKLFMQVTKTEQSLIKARAQVATVQGKYKKSIINLQIACGLGNTSKSDREIY